MMILIDREITTKEIKTDKGLTSMDCQASFNSDGLITLRNYNIGHNDSDEIIVLSYEETEAIFGLFRRLKKAFKDIGELPF